MFKWYALFGLIAPAGWTRKGSTLFRFVCQWAIPPSPRLAGFRAPFSPPSRNTSRLTSPDLCSLAQQDLSPIGDNPLGPAPPRTRPRGRCLDCSFAELAGRYPNNHGGWSKRSCGLRLVEFQQASRTPAGVALASGCTDDLARCPCIRTQECFPKLEGQPGAQRFVLPMVAPDGAGFANRHRPRRAG